MTKKKHFHSSGGKGWLARKKAFYCRKNPYDVMAQPLPKKKTAPLLAQRDGSAEQSLPDTDSASNDTGKGGNFQA